MVSLDQSADPEPWADPKKRSSLGLHSRHRRNSGNQTQGICFLDPPGVWKAGLPDEDGALCRDAAQHKAEGEKVGPDPLQLEISCWPPGNL